MMGSGAIGIVQNFGAQVIGAFLAPIVLVAVVQTYGWRSGFVLAGIPGLTAATRCCAR